MIEGLLVIGGSLGGLDSTRLLLSGLDDSFPDPVVVVLHRAKTSDGHAVISALEQSSRLAVREAEDKMPLVPGQILIAPADYHLFIERYVISLSWDEPVRFSRPSIDVAFESAALCCGSRTVAVVLSGANADGSIGAAAIRKAGGRVYVQDPATARAAEMPRAAIAAVPDALVMSPAAIGSAIGRLRRESQ